MISLKTRTAAALLAALVSLSLAPKFVRAQAIDVAVSADDAFYTLDNGIIKALISRKSGDLISVKYKGAEMMAVAIKDDGTPNLELDPPGDPGRGRGMTDHMYGFWSHDTIADRIESKITIDPKANNGDRGEVSIKGFSDGKKLGHGPGAPPDGSFAADIEIRYTLGRGDSGIYTYCIFDHKPDYPNATLGEARFCVKLNPEIFDWMLVSDNHNLKYPMELERDFDNKYNYTDVQWEHPAFGWAGFYRNVGFFFVNASVEYLTGPPTKVEFLCHRDTTPPNYAPTILNYWRSSHYGGASVDVAQGEKWTKVIGPFMLYCNTGNNPQTIWADALAQQKREAAKWPYDWVSGVDYPRKNERSTVSGQLVLTDPLMPPGTAVSNVRVGLAHPDYRVSFDRPVDVNTPMDIHWQVDAKNYEFWVRGSNDGAFSIPNVRAGKYTLHAIADGVLGEFAKADITVEAGKPLDLGKLAWTPVRRGKQIWDIGIANRTGREFFKGDDYFHDGMATIYALLFPDDITYTVGKSDFHKDWFYLHTAHATEAAIAAATVEAQPRQPRTGGAGFGFGARGGAATQPGGLARGGRGQRGGRGGPATQPAPGGGDAAPAPAAPAQPVAAPVQGGFGAARGGGGGGGGARPTPWNIVFDMPGAAHGKATLRLGIATNNAPRIDVAVNSKPAGSLTQLHNDSAIGRNGVQGIWFEREFAFDAASLKQGTNVLTLTVPGGGVIYDYLRLELDESAPPPTADAR